MNHLDLKPGTTCVANGRVVQIDRPDSMTHMRVRDMAKGETFVVPISRIEPVPACSKKDEIGMVSDAEWKRAAALAQDLAVYDQRARVPQAKMLKMAKRHGLSVRQLQRARAAYLKNASVIALVRSPGGRPEGLNRLDPKVDALIKHTIAKHFRRRERPTKESIVERVRSLARRLKLDPPSRKAVLLRIDQQDGWESDTARMGSKAAKQKWEPRPGGLSAAKPLELIQIDHTPADVIVVTDDRSKERGRPWVTLAIDVATRCVVGLYVTMDAPSSVSVSLCIEHAVLPKGENTDGVVLWPMYGKPSRILVDNGKDFRAMALERGCQEHGIHLSWRPVRTPHYGAHIERLIGTLMQITHELPGTTFSNIKQRGDYDSAGKARLTLDEYRQWLTQKICRLYHVRKHRSLGIAPLVAWERGWTAADGSLTSAALLSRPEEFRLDFLPAIYRPIRRTGISLHASRYWDDALAPLLNRKDDTLVRYDPRSPGQVWVRRDDGVVVTAPAIYGPALGAISDRVAVDEATQKRLDAEIDRGFEATDSVEESARKATEAARRKARGRKKSSRGASPEQPPLPLFEDDPAMTPARKNPMPNEAWN